MLLLLLRSALICSVVAVEVLLINTNLVAFHNLFAKFLEASTVEDVFTIGDLELPDGVKAILDPERHIAHVIFVQEEVDEPVEGAVDGEAGEEATPEVISEVPAEDAPAEEDSEGEE